MSIDKLSQKEVADALRTAAAGCCDDDTAQLLTLAADMLHGTKCTVKGCQRSRDVGSWCRPCYQAIRRKSHDIFDALQASAKGDST